MARRTAGGRKPVKPGRIAARTKVWFEHAGERVFGAGLARLCEAVRLRRSLTDAARDCGVSYRHAWNLLRTAGRRLGRPITVPRAGGPEGGGSRLSPEGERLLRLYRRVAEDVQSRAEALLDGLGKETDA